MTSGLKYKNNVPIGYQISLTALVNYEFLRNFIGRKLEETVKKNKIKLL